MPFHEKKSRFDFALAFCSQSTNKVDVRVFGSHGVTPHKKKSKIHRKVTTPVRPAVKGNLVSPASMANNDANQAVVAG